MTFIRYRSGYRFQLAEDYSIATTVHDAVRTTALGNDYVWLAPNGWLNVRKGYAWDGASGPVRQTPDIVRGSLVHDALYQLMRECGLSATWKPVADELLRTMCIEDGMPHWMAQAVYQAVKAFGGTALDVRSIAPVLIAPVPVDYRSTSQQEAP